MKTHCKLEILRKAEITLLVRLPGELTAVAIPVTIGELTAECLAPLPRNREVPWEFRDRQLAEEMFVRRKQLAAVIAGNLTERLLRHFERKDPVNGYSPEERAAMEGQKEKGER